MKFIYCALVYESVVSRQLPF